MENKIKTPAIVAGIAFLLIVLFVWGNRIIQKEELMKTQFEQLVKNRDSTESGIIMTMEEIDLRLDSIRDEYGYLVIGAGSNYDGLASKKEEIIGNIAMINSIMRDNRKKLKNLSASLNALNSKNHALKKKLETYTKRNEDYIAEIAFLNTELTQQRYVNDTLTGALQNQRSNYSVLDNDYKSLNTKYQKVEKDAYTAYYISGDKKQLKDLKIIERKSIAGLKIGPEKSAAYLPAKKFESIDIRDEAVIPVHTKKAKLITNHAKESYVWQDDEEGMKNLCILKPEMFWQSSKFLVIETK